MDKVTVDSAGRVLLPKKVRQELRISAGDTLDINLEGDNLTLRPRRAAARLARKRGIWVLRDTGSHPGSEQVRELMARLRDERDGRNHGDHT
ncbi:MAG: AbrB/MazE/SpoVT family DNA-binding domain-containing protein [Acidobacteria bacterium]|nr:AbrB/MazE/SpoVT family DNA-binding domain-containing protein [Acidobacteriota bacterium]